jgi:hypothetical protein
LTIGNGIVPWAQGIYLLLTLVAVLGKPQLSLGSTASFRNECSRKSNAISSPFELCWSLGFFLDISSIAFFFCSHFAHCPEFSTLALPKVAWFH